MGAVRATFNRSDQGFDEDVRICGKCLGVAMSDLLYIGLTIVVFTLLSLLVRGVEHFER
jgi:hypothetical protein